MYVHEGDGRDQTSEARPGRPGITAKWQRRLVVAGAASCTGGAEGRWRWRARAGTGPTPTSSSPRPPSRSVSPSPPWPRQLPRINYSPTIKTPPPPSRPPPVLPNSSPYLHPSSLVSRLIHSRPRISVHASSSPSCHPTKPRLNCHFPRFFPSRARRNRCVVGGSFGRGKRGAGPGAFQNSDRPAGRGEGAARSHCGGRGRVTAAFRSGGVRGCSRLLLVCLLPLALRRAAGLEVGGRPGAASPFRGRLSGAAAAAAGAWWGRASPFRRLGVA